MVMRRKQTFALMAGVIALAMTSCGGGTTQVIVQQSQVVQEPKVDVDTVEAVEPIKDVLSIEEAVKLLQAGEGQDHGDAQAGLQAERRLRGEPHGQI